MTDPRTAELLAALESDTTLEAAGPFLKIAADYFAQTRTGEGPVSTALSPAAIAARFDEPMPMGLKPLADVAARIERDVMPDVNRLMHPMAMGHQVAAPLASAVWSEVVISALNNSQAVWEMSPVGSVIEERVIGWMTQLAGLGPRAGGTFTSGGTEATFTALLAARAELQPDAWRVGFDPKKPMPVLVHGEHAHYAVLRAAGMMGLGTDNCVAVPSREFKMDVDALEAVLARLEREGRAALAVVATAGSTATGSFDNLEAIGGLCEQRGLWLHVDGAHGASALLSSVHRSKLRGIEKARTIAWDPHKMMLLPLSAGMVLARDVRDLERAFSQKAPYLFHGASRDDDVSLDMGTRSFQCSRRGDALKVWVALQRLGADGIGGMYEHLCSLTSSLYELLNEQEDVFEGIHAPEGNILCFRVRGTDGDNVKIREAYNRSGAGWVTSTVLGGTRVLRVTMMNPRSARSDLARTVRELNAAAASRD
ncbi:MAG: pyridoxal-dependent decarboxylase [Gemmatimonadaceae bacterium]